MNRRKFIKQAATVAAGVATTSLIPIEPLVIGLDLGSSDSLSTMQAWQKNSSTLKMERVYMHREACEMRFIESIYRANEIQAGRGSKLELHTGPKKFNWRPSAEKIEVRSIEEMENELKSY